MTADAIDFVPHIKEDIRRHAAELPPGHVVVVLDTRVPLAAHLAACLEIQPVRSESELAVSYVEASGLIGRFTEEHTDKGNIPVRIGVARRESLASAFEAWGSHELAVDLESAPDVPVVIITGDTCEIANLTPAN